MSSAASCPIGPLSIQPSPEPSTQEPAQSPSAILAQEILSSSQISPQTNVKEVKNTKGTKCLLLKALQSTITEAAVSLAQSIKKICKKITNSLTALFTIKKIDQQLEIELAELHSIQIKETPKKASRVLSLKLGIQKLIEQKNKCKERILNLRKVPPRFLSILSGVLTATVTLGSLTKTLPSAALIALRAAGNWVGGFAAGLSIPFGLFDIGLGIKRVIHASTRLKEAKQDLSELQEKIQDFSVLNDIWKSCYDLQRQKLLVHTLKSQRLATQSLFQTIMGSLAVVGGALGIASLLTGGWAAIGFGIAGGVLSIASISIAITSYIKERPLKQQIKKYHQITTEDLEKIGQSISLCDDAQKRSLANLLKVKEEDLIKDPLKTLQLAFKELLVKEPTP